jgi:outer membrane murein-binding lipoprotein Lpp
MKTWAWIVVPSLLLAGCSKKAEEPAKPTTLHEIMKNEIDNRADDVWAVGNKHMTEDPGLNGATMTDADWARLASASTSLQQAALDLAGLPDPIVVVKPGSKIAYEDTSWGDSAKSVQRNVDQDPQGVRDLANSLAQHMADLAAAANKHDAATAGRLNNELDGVCEDCHVKYWYPSQKALIDSIKKTSGIDPST